MRESRQSNPVIAIVDDDPRLGLESLMLRMADKLGIHSRKGPLDGHQGRTIPWAIGDAAAACPITSRKHEAGLAEAQGLARTGSLAWDGAAERFTHCSEETF
jgi:hypothetical protein